MGTQQKQRVSRLEDLEKIDVDSRSSFESFYQAHLSSMQTYQNRLLPMSSKRKFLLGEGNWNAPRAEFLKVFDKAAAVLDRGVNCFESRFVAEATAQFVRSPVVAAVASSIFGHFVTVELLGEWAEFRRRVYRSYRSSRIVQSLVEIKFKCCCGYKYIGGQD
ncbi:hypothetical protein K458DRAFT_400378 [Lentithecium fluviatile CBS 122367]|uniref:Uncharacterized protein n=1 Tax=Lentithecium fluviatile CBS 122367 TaxID=1168545 RepID=A0A6G1JHN3_9PLEO|nr:hypothetical protein K458DRAFT_400378 [Lentithecium fluviatile CBS 122367]